MTSERTYVRVVPSTETYDPSVITDGLRGLQHHSGTAQQSSGLLSRVFGESDPPTFEFLILSAGGDSPVEFYYGVDGVPVESLRTKLRNIYPESFEVTLTDRDPVRRIAPHAVYDPDEYEAAARVDAVWSADDTAADTMDTLPIGPENLDPAEVVDSDGPLRVRSEKIVARPALSELRPAGLRWHGVGSRRRDWMCRLTPLAAHSEASSAEGHPPLATLVDQIGEASIPLAFQVVFRPRPSWSGDRATRTEDIMRGEDTRVQRVTNALGEIVSGTHPGPRDRDELSETARRRLDEMEAADPETTFTATLRALTLQVDTAYGTALETAAAAPQDPAVQGCRPSDLRQLQGALAPLSGEFYDLSPTPFRAEGYRSTTRDRNAQTELERFQSRELNVSGSGRDRPHIVAGPDTLAGLVAVPSAAALSTAATRKTRATPQTQTPLPRPDPDRLAHFREGMAIGNPIDNARRPDSEPLCVPPSALTRHYARYGPTGAGKSTAVLNDVLSLHEATQGPTVLVDRKGDGMVENYLRAHYARFDDLDAVYCLSLPEMLPAVPFFDVRPGMDAGRDRDTVVQETVEHFRELLRLVMGEDLLEQAFVANEILAFLIKALFDPRYGHDAFGLDTLTDAALSMQQEQQLPATSGHLEEERNSLTRQFEKADGQFVRSMDAVLNRLDKLRENTHLAEILRTVPEWNEAADSCEGGTFDFRRLLDEDVVVLLDMGDLRTESSRAITLLLLSNLWDALQYRRRTADSEADDSNGQPMINLIIEEAAPLVASPLVHEDLLPQGRSFGLGLGLVMQFPEQVESVAAERAVGRRAYTELLNNVHTQIVGGITLTDRFGRSLVAEDLDVDTLRKRCNQLPAGEWIVDLPQTPFLEPPARPLSVQSLPIPEGHPQSDAPLPGDERETFQTVREDVLSRSGAAFTLGDHSRTTGTRQPLATTSPPTEGELHRPTTDGQSDEQVDDRSLFSAVADSVPSTRDADRSPSPRGGDGSSPGQAGTEGETPVAHSSSIGAETPSADHLPTPATTDLDGSPHPDSEASHDRPAHDSVQTVLQRVLRAMNHEIQGEALLGGMSDLVDIDGVDVASLIEDGYLESHEVDRKQYYTLTRRGLQTVRGQLRTGSGDGDLGEKMPHVVGVEALRAWLAQTQPVDSVEVYATHNGVVYDVVGYTGSSVSWVGEVETDSNNPESIADDYQKLAAVDAQSIWAVHTHAVAVETVLPALAERDLLQEVPTGRDANSMTALRSAIEAQDNDGMHTIRSFRTLIQEVQDE